jgi:hypothetical protein
MGRRVVFCFSQGLFSNFDKAKGYRKISGVHSERMHQIRSGRATHPRMPLADRSGIHGPHLMTRRGTPRFDLNRPSNIYGSQTLNHPSNHDRWRWDQRPVVLLQPPAPRHKRHSLPSTLSLSRCSTGVRTDRTRRRHHCSPADRHTLTEPWSRRRNTTCTGE